VSPTATWKLPARAGAHAPAAFTPAQVMEALGAGGFLPSYALTEAVRLREEMIPLLLAELERVADDPRSVPEESDWPQPYEYAAALLAQFRDARAFGPLLRSLRHPDALVDRVWRPLLPDQVGDIVASVAHGRAEPLQDLVLRRSASELARIIAIEALLTLVAEGELAREDMIAFLRRGLRSLGEGDEHVAAYLVCAADELHPGEMLEEIRVAYARHRVDAGVIGLDAVEETAAQLRERVMSRLRVERGYVSDAIALFADDPDFGDDETPAPGAPDAWAPEEPYRRDQPKVGRNDPCPCGSGKKFKKCCMVES